MNNSCFTCKLCKSGHGVLVQDHVRDSTIHSVFSCDSCGHVQLFPLPDYDENMQFYDKNKQASWVHQTTDVEALRKHLKTDTIRRANYVEKHFSTKTKILDIGCGYGFFSEEMINRGWDINCLEISHDRRKIAEQITMQKIYNFDVCKEGNIPDYLTDKFDVIVAFQVFEHILQPLEFLTGVKKLLKPGGKIILELPNRDDHMLKISNGYLKFYYQKAHVSYFNSGDLKNIFSELQLTNTEIKYIQRYSVDNFMNWMVSGQVQTGNPSFNSSKDIAWLDDYYRSKLCSNGQSDTFIIKGVKL